MINLTVVIDNDEAIKKFKELQVVAKTTTTNVVSDAERMDLAFSKLKSGLAKFGLGLSLAEFGRQVVTVRGEFQMLEVAFETLLGNKQAADELMNQMVDLAATTPFDLKGVADGARQLLAYGFASEEITDTLTRLGDVAAGLGLPLERLTYLYGTTAVQGRLFTKDMQQFLGSGINISKALADMYDKTENEINEMVSAGKIGFEDVRKAIESMTNEGGQFHSMMAKQSQTITGLLSALGDAIDTMFNDLGKQTEGVIADSIKLLISLVENYEKFLPVLGSVIASFGVYKAAVMAVAAAHKVMAIASFASRFLVLAKNINSAAKAMRLLTVATKANPWGLILGAITGIVSALFLWDRETDKQVSSLGILSKAAKQFKETTDSLISAIYNENLAETEKQMAFDSLQKMYPELLKNMTREDLAKQGLTETTKKLAEEQAKLNKEALVAQGNRLYTESLEAKKTIEKHSSTPRSRQTLATRQAVDTAKKTIELNNKAIKDINRQLRQIDEAEKKIADAASKPILSVQENLTKAAEDYREAQGVLQKLIRENADVNKVTAAQGEVDTKKKAYEEALSLAGIDPKEQEKLYKAHEDARKNYLDNLVAQNEAYNTEIEDAERSQITDSIKLLEYDRDRKLDAIEQEKQAYIALVNTYNSLAIATGKPLVSVDTSVFDKRAKLVEDATNKEIENEKRARKEVEEEAMNSYLAQYGTFEQKKQAIREQYRKKIESATTEGEKKILTAQMEEELTDLTYEATKASSAISAIFTDMSTKTVAELERLLSVAEQVMSLLQGDSYNAALGVTLGISKEDYDRLKSSPEPLNDIAEAIEKIKNKAEDTRSPFKKMGDALSNIFKKGGGDPNNLNKNLEDLVEGLSTVTAAANFVGTAFGDMAEATGSEAMASIAEGISIATDAANKAMEGIQVGAAVGGTAGAVIGGVIGAVSSLVTSFSKLHDRRHERQIELLQEKIDDVTRSYEKLDEAVSRAYSSTASNLIRKQNELLEKQKRLIQQQIKEEEAKKNTDDERIKEWKLELEDINQQIQDNKQAQIDAIFGDKVSSAISDFAEAYADAWSSNEDRAKTAADFIREQIKSAIVEAMKADISEPVNQIRKRIAEFLQNDGRIDDIEQNQLDTLMRRYSSELDNKYSWADKYLNNAEETEEAAMRGEISQAMTEVTASKLEGIMRGQYDVIKGVYNEACKQTVIQQGLSSSIANISSDLAKTQSNTYRTAVNTTGITDILALLEKRLSKIETNTTPKYYV